MNLSSKTTNVELFNFKQLISPIDFDDFFSTYWETKPLVLSNRSFIKYDNLFSIEAADFLLSSLIAPTDSYNSIKWVRFINNKKELIVEDYLHNGTDFLNMEKVMMGFRRGNTIVLNRLHQRWEPVQKLCSHFEEILGHPVRANMYLTPHNAQGFEAHYDPHDVFILQIEGEKLWKIYDHHVKFPIGKKDSPFLKPLDPPLYEVYLKPGDLIYIPRGHVHEASTAKNYSLHLTFGVHALTWVDFINEVALTEDSLRRSLPRGILHEGCKQDIQELKIETLKKLCLDDEISNKVLTQLRAKFSESKTEPLQGHFSSYHAAEKITAATLLKKKTVKYTITKQENMIVIQFEGTKIKMPIHVENFLQYILVTPEFSVLNSPNFLSESDKLLIVRLLIKTNFLSLA